MWYVEYFHLVDGRLILDHNDENISLETLAQNTQGRLMVITGFTPV